MIRELNFNHMHIPGIIKQGKVDFFTVFGTQVVQLHAFCSSIVEKMNMFEQRYGKSIFQLSSLVSRHQSGIIKIKLGLLEDGTGDIFMIRAYKKNNIQAFQYGDVALHSLRSNL